MNATKDINIGRFPQLLSPKYWLPWLAIGLMRLIASLPYRCQLILGIGLGQVAKKLLARQYHGCQINLQLCFPHLDAAKQRQLLNQYFKSLGISCIELCSSLFLSHQRFNNLIKVTGSEHLAKAQAEGKCIIIITAHFTTLPIIVRLLTQTLPLSVVLRPQKNLIFNRLLVKRSEQALQKITYINRDNVRKIMRSMKEGEALLYLPDQDIGARHSLFVPFFDIPAASTHALSQLADFKSAAVIPLFCERTAKGYQLRFDAAVDNFPTQDAYQDMLRINQLFENEIKKYPEQYLWSYNRFRTRPNDEPDVYKYELRKSYK